jgi:hypothetical protein
VLSSDSACLLIGNDRLPCEVTVRDYRLRPVVEGVTPLEARVPAGLYEVELRSETDMIHHLLRADAGSLFDGSDLGLSIETTVPISSARNRDQAKAEAATILSARLSYSGASCGLAIVLLANNNDGRSRSDSSAQSSVTVLDCQL